MWRERLSDFTRQPATKAALGWSTKVTLEASVVNLNSAAGEGSRGLLHPLLKRYQASRTLTCVVTVYVCVTVCVCVWRGLAAAKAARRAPAQQEQPAICAALAASRRGRACARTCRRARARPRCLRCRQCRRSSTTSGERWQGARCGTACIAARAHAHTPPLPALVWCGLAPKITTTAATHNAQHTTQDDVGAAVPAVRARCLLLLAGRLHGLHAAVPARGLGPAAAPAAAGQVGVCARGWCGVWLAGHTLARHTASHPGGGTRHSCLRAATHTPHTPHCCCAREREHTHTHTHTHTRTHTHTHTCTHTHRTGFLCVLSSVLSLVSMAAFLYMELCTIAAYGWGWLRAWNVLDMASYILQVRACACACVHVCMSVCVCLSVCVCVCVCVARLGQQQTLHACVDV
jgi:hypothetical protein